MDRRLVAVAATAVALPLAVIAGRRLIASSAARSARRAIQTLDPSEVPTLRRAIEGAYQATLHAFKISSEDTDFDERDRAAAAAAERLHGLVESTRSRLAPDLASACDALDARLSAANVQLMAFAINRKNRGLPDAAALETETADRRALTKELEPVYTRLLAAFNA